MDLSDVAVLAVAAVAIALAYALFTPPQSIAACRAVYVAAQAPYSALLAPPSGAEPPCRSFYVTKTFGGVVSASGVPVRLLWRPQGVYVESRVEAGGVAVEIK